MSEYSTIREIVARKLREEILSGLLAPGQNLNINQLCQRFKCSVTPIREAVSILGGEGLLLADRYKSVTVIKLDRKEIREIFEIRALLESYASSFAASNMNEEILRTLRANLREQEICNQKALYDKWFELNYAFHNEIYKCTKQSALLEIIDMLRNRTFHYVRTYTILLNRCGIAISEHKGIFNAILKRNSADAGELMNRHLANLAKSLNSYLETKQKMD